MTAPFGLTDTATCIGHYAYLERRGFEILGGWTVEVADPVAKAMVDRHAQHHAWRAGQWWDRLPMVAHLERDALIAPPPTPAVAMVDALGGLASTVGRLAGAYRVALPRLAATYRSHLETASPVADGPIIRTLRMVLADVEADWREGEVALHTSLTTPTETYAAAYAVARLEAILVRP